MIGYFPGMRPMTVVQHERAVSKSEMRGLVARIAQQQRMLFSELVIASAMHSNGANCSPWCSGPMTARSWDPAEVALLTDQYGIHSED